MPPSVARSQLPKDLAHATKEPSQDDGITRFLDGCCTNGTEINSSPHDKLLFLCRFLSAAIFGRIDRAAGQLSALLHPEVDRCRIKPNFHRKFSNWTAMPEGESWQRPSRSFMPRRLRFAPDANQIVAASMGGTRNRHETWRPTSRKRLHFQQDCPITTWIGPGTLTAANLVLAARARVGHIGLAGDVAEWLKAAVC
jgi:hypothetical protein